MPVMIRENKVSIFFVQCTKDQPAPSWIRKALVITVLLGSESPHHQHHILAFFRLDIFCKRWYIFAFQNLWFLGMLRPSVHKTTETHALICLICLRKIQDSDHRILDFKQSYICRRRGDLSQPKQEQNLKVI